ncbi:hypothetical protein CC86DRAFT_407839 [Ophiobolus disseminans]|uniref:Glycogen debranching enzyme n=1 Tax=Ophiobolus disseminans TaxID=1469910 RepID=A0A6A6ZVB5_9PLEO|nr:hypothetical protein CC86DRAFT_407839 [Ophiobolus disseminans]
MVFMITIATFLLASAAALAPRTPQAPSILKDPPPYTNPPTSCPEAASRLSVPDGPHANYFYSDCHQSVHVIVTSPRSGDKLSVVKPRLLVAWPAGNSGAFAQFESGSGQAGSLSVTAKSDGSKSGEAFDPIYEAGSGGNPRVGVTSVLHFNDSAILAVPILGSIRSLREFAEGGKIDQAFQDSFGFLQYTDGSASIDRLWFDGVTKSTMHFTPLNGAQTITINRGEKWTLGFGQGDYKVEVSYNYPQLDQLSPQEVLADAAKPLLSQNPDLTTSLAFLSYKNKLLAGTWRFLTYFGRDSMISMLLMQDILSHDAIEAVIAAVVERINHNDGTVCHEEVLGDYASYLNKKEGIISAEPRCDYKMVDTDFLLPIAMQRYFLDTKPGQQNAKAFFEKVATFLPENKGWTYTRLAQVTAEKIMRIAAPFANSQTKENLISLRNGEMVGQWRDSNYGLGGGRTPYDVNTALVPAGLRAIAALSRAGFFPDHPDWKDLADKQANIWEDETLRFFEINVSESDAKARVREYVLTSRLGIDTNADTITGDVKYYGLALGGSINSGGPVPVMNTDDCFRHFFLNTTHQEQLSSFLSQTADHILQPFPAGLSTDVGLVVANPAYATDADFRNMFAQGEYHGTVVWSWQLAMMGAGLGRQLGRCTGDNHPEFCTNKDLHSKVLSAYNRLWDTIDANRAQLSHEVWSWSYDGSKFKAVPLGAITSTESNVRQLWSLTFLAVHREKF